MSKTAIWAVAIVALLVLGIGVWYSSKSSPSTAGDVGGAQMQDQENVPQQPDGINVGESGSASPQQQSTSGSGASGNATARASIDAAASSIESGYQSEATQANSENGTESATQLNSTVDNQTVYAQ